MVTKKTRLLSAIMAVMMLVTLFTGIVLPASAVTVVPDLPTVTKYHASVQAGSPLTGKELTVATLAELELVSLYQSTFNSEYTIYFIDDIAIPTTGYVAGQASGTSGDANAMSSLLATLNGCYAEGGMAKISGIRVEQNWLGTYTYGKGIYNIHFDDCKATATGNGGAVVFGSNTTKVEKKFENIKMTNCSITKGGKSNNLSLFCGKTNGAPATFRNFWIENCSIIDHQNNTGGPCNLGFLQAATKYSLTLENIYLVNNTIDIDWLDNGHAAVVGEVTQGDADTFVSAKNIAVFGTTLNINNEGEYGGSAAANGLNNTLGAVLGAASNYTLKTDGPAITLDNILVYGNDKGTHTFNSVVSGAALESAGGDISIKATNVSTDLPSIVREEIYEEQSDKSGYKTVYVQKLTADSTNNTVNGDADNLFDVAVQLNKAGVSTKWAWDGEKPVLADDEHQEILEVALKVLDAKSLEEVAVYYDYTDAKGKLMNGADYTDEALYWEEDPADAVISKENPVLLGYAFPAHEHIYEYTDNGDGTHKYKCTFAYDDGENQYICDKAGNAAHDNTVYKNITSTNTAAPAASHYAVPGCKFCTYKDTGAASVRHETLVKDTEKSTESTCTDTGIAVMYCEECDYVHTGIEAVKEHSWTRYEQIDGYNNHKTLCQYCDAAKPSLDSCEFSEWEETKPATIYEEGEAVSSCVCGKQSTKVLPKLAGIELNAEKAKVGNEFKVEINLKNNPGVGGMNLKLTYNADALVLKGSEKGDWDIAFIPDGIPGATGTVSKNIHIVSAEDMEGDGTLLTLIFEVKNDEDLLAGTNTEISVEVVNAYNYEDLDAEISFEGFEKEILLNSGLTKGDMSGDAVVDLQDAIYLLRYLNKPDGSPSSYEVAPGVIITEKMANLTSLNDNQDLGDGTTTGTVNIYDVIHLLEYLNFQLTDEEFFGE